MTKEFGGLGTTIGAILFFIVMSFLLLYVDLTWTGDAPPILLFHQYPETMAFAYLGLLCAQFKGAAPDFNDRGTLGLTSLGVAVVGAGLVCYYGVFPSVILGVAELCAIFLAATLAGWLVGRGK